MERFLSRFRTWWPWLPLPLGFVAEVVIKRVTSVTFSADVFFWSFSTVIQGFLAALAFAALIGWEQMNLLRSRIAQILERELSAATQKKLCPEALAIPISETMVRIDRVLSEEPDPGQRDRLKMARNRVASLQRLETLLISQVVATAASVLICVVCLPFSEALSGKSLGTFCLSIVTGLGLTCVLFTILVAHYSIGRGRGKP
jgi:hypothetical protein